VCLRQVVGDELGVGDRRGNGFGWKAHAHNLRRAGSTRNGGVSVLSESLGVEDDG
jgi:hypothetical protein